MIVKPTFVLLFPVQKNRPIGIAATARPLKRISGNRSKFQPRNHRATSPQTRKSPVVLFCFVLLLLFSFFLWKMESRIGIENETQRERERERERPSRGLFTVGKLNGWKIHEVVHRWNTEKRARSLSFSDSQSCIDSRFDSEFSLERYGASSEVGKTARNPLEIPVDLRLHRESNSNFTRFVAQCFLRHTFLWILRVKMATTPFTTCRRYYR